MTLQKQCGDYQAAVRKKTHFVQIRTREPQKELASLGIFWELVCIVLACRALLDEALLLSHRKYAFVCLEWVRNEEFLFCGEACSIRIHKSVQKPSLMLCWRKGLPSYSSLAGNCGTVAAFIAIMSWQPKARGGRSGSQMIWERSSWCATWEPLPWWSSLRKVAQSYLTGCSLSTALTGESSSRPVGVNKVRCKEVLKGVLSVPEVSSGVRIMSICHVHDVGISTGQYRQPQRQQGNSWKSRCYSLTARVQKCGSYQIFQHNETTYLNTSTEI